MNIAVEAPMEVKNPLVARFTSLPKYLGSSNKVFWISNSMVPEILNNGFWYVSVIPEHFGTSVKLIMFLNSTSISIG